jgi:hypothetical protein
MRRYTALSFLLGEQEHRITCSASFESTNALKALRFQEDFRACPIIQRPGS